MRIVGTGPGSCKVVAEVGDRIGLVDQTGQTLAATQVVEEMPCTLHWDKVASSDWVCWAILDEAGRPHWISEAVRGSRCRITMDVELIDMPVSKLWETRVH